MGVGAGAIRAGLAVVELSADAEGLAGGLAAASARLKGWAGSVARIGAGLAGVGAAVVGPILASFKGAVDQAAGMGTLATQLGLTAEKASAFAYAMGTVGVAEEEVLGFARHMNTMFASAADGSHEAIEAFAKLGLNWQELAKMDTVERFLAVKEALGKINNEFDKSNQAGHFFGARKGMEALKISADEYRKRIGEASEVGAVVSPEQVTQAKEIRRAYDQIGAAMKYAFLEVGRALLPHAETVKEYARTVVNVAKGVRAWVQDNKSLVTGALLAGAAVTAAGAALVGLGVIGASVAGIIGGVGAAAAVIFSPAVGGAAGAFLAAMAPLALAAGAAYLFFTRTEAGGRMVGQLARNFAPFAAEGVKAFGVVKQTAIDAWGGISSALKRGDLSSAWLIVQAGADVAWEQVKASFGNVWDEIITRLRNDWDKAVAYLGGSMSKMLGDLAGLFAGTLATMLRNLADVANRLGGTTAAKLAGKSGALKLLGSAAGAGADALGGAGAGAREWQRRRKEAAEQALAEAKDARDHADAYARGVRETAVKDRQAALRAVLDEERRAAGAAGKPAAGMEGGGAGTLQQAVREVRGNFNVGFGSSAQQAFAVGSQTPVRQLVGEVGITNQILTRIEGKIEPGAFG